MARSSSLVFLGAKARLYHMVFFVLLAPPFLGVSQYGDPHFPHRNGTLSRRGIHLCPQRKQINVGNFNRLFMLLHCNTKEAHCQLAPVAPASALPLTFTFTQVSINISLVV